MSKASERFPGLTGSSTGTDLKTPDAMPRAPLLSQVSSPCIFPLPFSIRSQDTRQGRKPAQPHPGPPGRGGAGHVSLHPGPFHKSILGLSKEERGFGALVGQRGPQPPPFHPHFPRS